jgi:uncharacterized protein (TIGR04255 family)
MLPALLEAFERYTPIYDEERSQTEPSAQGRGSVRNNLPIFRFFDADDTTTISVSPTSIGIETTSYPGFETLRSMILDVFSSVRSLANVSLIRRVGLRYLNEIRVPAEEIKSVRDWSSWIHPSLTQITEVGVGLTPRVYEGVIRYEIGDYRWLLFRFGALEYGSIFREGLLRKHRNLDRGPVFILDFDAYCQPAPGQTPNLEVEALGRVLEDLHNPTEQAFRSAISEKLSYTLGGER